MEQYHDISGNEQKDPEEKKREETVKKRNEAAVKGLIIVALVILLVAGILLPIRLVPNTFGTIGDRFQSLFDREESFSLQSNKIMLQSGEEFILSWRGGPREQTANYVVDYQCIDGIEIEYVSSTATEVIECDTPYSFSTDTKSITLRVVSETQALADVEVTVENKTGSGNLRVVGTMPISVINDRIAARGQNATSTISHPEVTTETPAVTSTTTVTYRPATPSTSTTTPATPSTPSVPQTPTAPTTPAVTTPTGNPDLTISTITLGKLVGTTFVPATSFSSTDRIAVRFVVSNIGTRATGAWRFNASLPTLSPAYTFYQSPVQQSLGGGSHIEYTLSFDNPKTGTNQIVLVADSANSVRESNEMNNTAIRNIVVAGGTATGTTVGADLAIKIIDTGIFQSGKFVSRSRINDRDTAAIQFEVTNLGTVTSGTWSYEIDFKDRAYKDEQSKTLSGLYPGEKRIYTAWFDVIDNKDIDLTVSIMPDGNDARSSNNKDDKTIDVR